LQSAFFASTMIDTSLFSNSYYHLVLSYTNRLNITATEISATLNLYCTSFWCYFSGLSGSWWNFEDKGNRKTVPEGKWTSSRISSRTKWKGRGN